LNWPLPKIPKTYKQNGTTKKQWFDWRWQISNSIKTADALEEFAPEIGKKKITAIKKVLQHRYQNKSDEMRLTPYLFSLIDFKNHQDPVALQHFPQIEETEEDDFTFEKVWEIKKDFQKGNSDENRLLQQKYPDIALLRISNTCASFCRFCFEKERTLRHDVVTKISKTVYEKAIEAINANKKLRQVLLSGGDPLILNDEQLKQLFLPLLKIEHLKTIRINTRTLLHDPYRITDELAQMLGNLQRESWKWCEKGKQIQIGLHFNHPQEITTEAITAIRKLQREGIELYNQTVLLKGINDNLKTLQALFRLLRAEGVRLHYLSQPMEVPRTSHFMVSVEKGQKLMEALRKTNEFRAQLPFYEMSHHSGKQLIPTMMNKNFKSTTHKKNGKTQKAIGYLSDVTGKWETYTNGED
jgi:lysine 2,3-aminomutase